MPNKSHLEAANGADIQKKTPHNPLIQGEGGAKRGPGISEKGGNIPANVPAPTHSSTDNKTPVRSHVSGKKTSVRGGGGREGHDRTNPNSGKAKSKDHKATRVL